MSEIKFKVYHNQVEENIVNDFINIIENYNKSVIVVDKSSYGDIECSNDLYKSTISIVCCIDDKYEFSIFRKNMKYFIEQYKDTTIEALIEVCEKKLDKTMQWFDKYITIK